MTNENKTLKMPSPQKLVDKWSPVLKAEREWEDILGGVKGITDSRMAYLVSSALEQTEQVSKIQDGGGTFSGAGGTSGTVHGYSPILIPMIRRIVPALIANDVLGVQPLKGPTGLVFALRSVYQGNSSQNHTTQYNTKNNDSFLIRLPNDVMAALGSTVGMNPDFNENDGEGWEFYSTDAGTGESDVIFGNIIFIDKDSQFALVKVKNASGFENHTDVIDTVNAFENLEVQIDEELKGERFAPGETMIYPNIAQYKALLPNYSGPYTTLSGENLSYDIPEIGFDITKFSVTANSRKLKARFTQELEEDMQAVHGLSPEKVLTTIGVDEITLEMNREIITMLKKLALKNGTQTIDFSSSDQIDGRWEAEKYRNILASINRSKKRVALRTFRGQSTFIIMSPGIFSAMQSIGAIEPSIDPINQSFVGTLSGMKAYVDVWSTEEYYLTGFKGNSDIDAGVFYSPYVPLKIEKGFGEENAQPRLFFRTRYGLTENTGDIAGPESYYDMVFLENLPSA